MDKKDFISLVAEAFQEPYDDRNGERAPGLPTVHSVATEFNATPHRVKKALITAGMYSSSTSRLLKKMREQMSIEEIAETTGWSRATIVGYLPYEKGIYRHDKLVGENGDENEGRSGDAIRSERWRKRQEALELLQAKVETGDWKEALWNSIKLFQGYRFWTSGKRHGASFTYQVKTSTGDAEDSGDELTDTLLIRRGTRKDRTRSIGKGIIRAAVELALERAFKEQEQCGFVSGPEKLGTSGASYLFAIFLKFRLIKNDMESEKTHRLSKKDMVALYNSWLEDFVRGDAGHEKYMVGIDELLEGPERRLNEMAYRSFVGGFFMGQEDGIELAREYVL